MLWQVRDYLTGGLLRVDHYEMIQTWLSTTDLRKIKSNHDLCIIYVL